MIFIYITHNRFGRLEELIYLETKIRKSNPIFFIRRFKENNDSTCLHFNKTCIEYAAQTFREAVHHLKLKHQGKIPKWGDLHHSRFDHIILNRTPLKCLASRIISSPGGSFTGN